MTTSKTDATNSGLVEQRINTRLEALKLVSDWSKGAILIQTAGLGAVGALLTQTPSDWTLVLMVALCASLISSIYFGAVAVSGTVPYIAQTLADNPTCDIYDQRGGIKRGGITRGIIANMSLGMMCIWQARLFTLSLVLFALFALSRTIG